MFLYDSRLTLQIQISLLQILITYWPQSTPEWFTSEVRTDLYQLAETWSNFHLPEVYTAGANLFQWLFTTYVRNLFKALLPSPYHRALLASFKVLVNVSLPLRVPTHCLLLYAISAKFLPFISSNQLL